MSANPSENRKRIKQEKKDGYEDTVKLPAKRARKTANCASDANLDFIVNDNEEDEEEEDPFAASSDEDSDYQPESEDD